MIPSSFKAIFPPTFEAGWGKAKESDRLLFEELTDLDSEEKNLFELAPEEFPKSLLALYLKSKQAKILIQDDSVPISLTDVPATFFAFTKLLRIDNIESAIEQLDFSIAAPLDKDESMLEESQKHVRRSKYCPLRLFLILIVDDAFYVRLLTESKAGHTRKELDSGLTHGNSLFWRDVHVAFVNDDYRLPKIPVDHPMFFDPSGNYVDVRKCESKLVTSEVLRGWYNTAHNQLVQYKANYDKSGQHDFKDVGSKALEEFVTKFAAGHNDVCFLAALAQWRGKDALEWVSGKLPEGSGFDGLQATVPTSATKAMSMSRNDVEDDELRSLLIEHMKERKAGSPPNNSSSLDDEMKKSELIKRTRENMAMAMEMAEKNRISEKKRLKVNKAADSFVDFLLKVPDELRAVECIDCDNSSESNSGSST